MSQHRGKLIYLNIKYRWEPPLHVRSMEMNENTSAKTTAPTNKESAEYLNYLRYIGCMLF